MEDLFVEWQHTETENSFSVFTEPQVDVLELFVFSGIDSFVLSLIEDSATIFPDFFRGAFNVSNIMVIRTLLSDDRESVFVGGVERHLGI